MPELRIVNPAAREATAPAALPSPKRGNRPPLLVRRKAAAALCGVSPASWDRLDAAGKTPAAIRLGGAKLYATAELAEWCRRGCPPRAEWSAVWAGLSRT